MQARGWAGDSNGERFGRLQLDFSRIGKIYWPGERDSVDPGAREPQNE